MVLALLPLVWLVSCGPSNEQLGENWEKNKSTANEVAKKYPNLKVWIEEEVANGTSVFDEATAEKDEDKKGDLLASANNKIEKGLTGHIGGLESKSDLIGKALSELFSKAKGLSVDESAVKYKEVLNADYASLEEAKTAVLGAKAKAEKAEKAIVDLTKKVKELEDLKREAGSIEAKIDASLSDAEYTVRVLKQVNDLKEVANDAKIMYTNPYANFAIANTVVTYQISAIKEKLAPLKALLKDNSGSDSTSVDNSNTTTTTTTTQTDAMCKCKYCKTENVCTVDKCKKCNAPL